MISLNYRNQKMYFWGNYFEFLTYYYFLLNNFCFREKAVSYGTILLNLFNAVVNKKLLYQNEIKYKYQNKVILNRYV